LVYFTGKSEGGHKISGNIALLEVEYWINVQNMFRLQKVALIIVVLKPAVWTEPVIVTSEVTGKDCVGGGLCDFKGTQPVCVQTCPTTGIFFSK